MLLHIVFEPASQTSRGKDSNLFKRYKKYCGLLSILLKRVKKRHYENEFSKHENDPKNNRIC